MFAYRSTLHLTTQQVWIRQSAIATQLHSKLPVLEVDATQVSIVKFAPYCSMRASEQRRLVFENHTRNEAMSVNVTIPIPLANFLDIKAGRTPDCGPDVLQALLRAIRTAPCEVNKKPYCPPAIEAPPTNKKITYTKVTRFRKPDEPPIYGVLLTVEGSVDCKKYRMDHWSKMQNLKAALSKTNGIALKDFFLYYQGFKIEDFDTPETLGMTTHDRIQMRKVVRPK